MDDKDKIDYDIPNLVDLSTIKLDFKNVDDLMKIHG